MLKRHYQFWFAILGLHKLGAVAIPATNQLVVHDYEYRFNAAGVSAVVVTADGKATDYIDEAQKNSPTLKIKIVANIIVPVMVAVIVINSIANTTPQNVTFDISIKNGVMAIYYGLLFGVNNFVAALPVLFESKLKTKGKMFVIASICIIILLSCCVAAVFLDSWHTIPCTSICSYIYGNAEMKIEGGLRFPLSGFC